MPQADPETNKKYNNTYYGKKKEELKERHGVKHLCACGKSVPKWHQSRHEKSNQHLKKIENL